MKLVTGMFKSQVYFKGALLDVAWSQMLCDNYQLVYELFEPKYPLLMDDPEFRRVLYLRSLQIEEAKTLMD